MSLLIKGALIFGQETADLLVVDGVIAVVDKAGTFDVPSDAEVLEADGLVALPVRGIAVAAS